MNWKFLNGKDYALGSVRDFKSLVAFLFAVIIVTRPDWPSTSTWMYRSDKVRESLDWVYACGKPKARVVY